MDVFRIGLAAAVAVTLGMGAGLIIGQTHGEAVIKEQAAERGYMVQCLGKAGWYWECDK